MDGGDCGLPLEERRGPRGLQTQQMITCIKGGLPSLGKGRLGYGRIPVGSLGLSVHLLVTFLTRLPILLASVLSGGRKQHVRSRAHRLDRSMILIHPEDHVQDPQMADTSRDN